jgi:DNA polymerase III subunit epsilon
MYAVIDTETTGLSLASDRVIELGIIGLDTEGNVEWEWCSLINPERDTGHGLAVRVHQIYPRDVANAPTFSQLAGEISERLSGRALMGHNIRFDLGMVAAEFERLGYAVPDLIHVCTADLARIAGFRPYHLHACCTALGIEFTGAHHALADARATASLAQRLVDFSDPVFRSDLACRLNASISWPDIPVLACRPVTRPILPIRKESTLSDVPVPHVRNLASFGETQVPVIQRFSLDSETPESEYLAAVEWVLEDRSISADQNIALKALRSDLHLSDDQVREVHMTFVRGLAGSMWADGSISEHEQFDLDIVGAALDLSPEDVNYARDHPIGLGLVNKRYSLEPGAKVAFTGEMSISRAEWQSRAQAAGLQVKGSVSSKTDFLVVPFGETGSSKSRKARELGVTVVTEQRFKRMIDALSGESGLAQVPAATPGTNTSEPSRSEDTVRILRDAVDTGEILSVAYHGGSRPGALREIAPIRIEEDLVVAHCYDSGKVKAFRVSQIQVFRNGKPITAFVPQEGNSRISAFQDLSDVIAENRHELLALGWDVYADREDISLYRKFKNGKRRKHPDVRIQFIETTEEWYFDPEMECRSEVRKRARPWVISLRDGGTAFSRLDRAVERFMSEARKRAPSDR